MTREELAKKMWEAAEQAPNQREFNNPYSFDDPVMVNVRSRYLAAADVALELRRQALLDAAETVADCKAQGLGLGSAARMLRQEAER